MKKTAILLLLLGWTMLAASCTAESAHGDFLNQTDEEAAALNAIVGIWKATVVSSVTAEETQYETAVIHLLKDGSGTYRGREITWKYDSEQNTILFHLTKENINGAFEILEENGKTILKFYMDTYYREADHNEKG